MRLAEHRLRGPVYLTLELYRPLQKMTGQSYFFASNVGAALRGRPSMGFHAPGGHGGPPLHLGDESSMDSVHSKSESVSQQNS